MPESPLSVTEVPIAAARNQYVDLSQDPTYALITTLQLPCLAGDADQLRVRRAEPGVRELHAPQPRSSCR